MIYKKNIKVSLLINSIFFIVFFGTSLFFGISYITRAEEPDPSVLDAINIDPVLPENSQGTVIEVLVGGQLQDPENGLDQNDLVQIEVPKEIVQEQESVNDSQVINANDPPAPTENDPPADRVLDTPSPIEPPANDNASQDQTLPSDDQEPGVVVPEHGPEPVLPAPQQPLPIVKPDILLNVPVATRLQPEIVIPKKALSFSKESGAIATKKDLPWYPDKYKTGETTENNEVDVEILNSDPPKIVFNGACSKTFFVVLGFANPDDYIEDPGKFIYNKAYSCKNGTYYYELDDLSSGLSDGVYYFMVAEEGLVGPWRPITALQPIRSRSEYR